jgi:signal transduction histidine kinase
MAVVYVRDNGIGIAAGHLANIFGMFQRLSRDKGGAGLGLAVCQRIIERHGGRIWVESVPGEGSVFVFTLPTTD